MRFAMALALLAPMLLAPGGAGTDLHQFWEGTCADCHGHAGPFARRFLTVEDGRLLGRHHRDDLAAFLANHHVPRDLVGPVHDMLLAQASTPPRFQERCGRCHESAAALARESLELRDGTLYARKSGQALAQFLPRHAKLRLTAEEIGFFTDLLARLEREVRQGG